MTSPEPGLCCGCVHGQAIVSGRGSTFWRCGEHDRDPAWPKYPRLPVLRCARFAVAEGVSPDGGRE